MDIVIHLDYDWLTHQLCTLYCSHGFSSDRRPESATLLPESDSRDLHKAGSSWYELWDRLLWIMISNNTVYFDFIMTRVLQVNVDYSNIVREKM